jgi:hypothetical protein
MKARRKITRLAIATLLATAAAAPPVATAMPVKDAGYTSKAYAPSAATMDIHASTVKPPAAAGQDLRSEGSIPASSRQASVVQSDLRTEAAADPSRAPKNPVGMPTWPVDPQPLTPPAQQPVASVSDGGDFEWPIAVLALGALMLGGGVLLAGHRLRTQARFAG